MLHTLSVVLALIGLAAIALVIVAVWTALVSRKRPATTPRPRLAATRSHSSVQLAFSKAQRRPRHRG
jgi:hypothetical protein